MLQCVTIFCTNTALRQVLKRPESPADARSIPAAIVARDMPVWKTVLVILRELCFTDQDLSERCEYSKRFRVVLALAPMRSCRLFRALSLPPQGVQFAALLVLL